MPKTKKYFWIALVKPTKWPIKDATTGQVVIPKGSTGVDMAPHQSSIEWERSLDGKIVRQHVYRWNGKIINA